MTDTTSRMIFVNLPVRNLKKSMEFFRTLGFAFNMQFTDDNAACMIISGDAFVMLLQDDYFKTFTPREICDPATSCEGLYAVSCSSRADVDALVEKALATGAREATEAKDHGFMFVRTFYDLDGHHWEFMWMDPAAVQAPPEVA